MEGPILIVTVASRGLGAATARVAARMGASVVLAARSLDRLKEIEQEIQEAGGQGLACLPI